MWKNFVSTVANQIYLDLPPSITQISFDIFNRCSFRAILFKFEYISYSNISLSTQISQIFHEPGTILTIILPKHRTLTFSRFLFCIFTIYIQFSSNKRTHCSNQHEKFHSFILVNDASSQLNVLNVIIRSTKYPVQSSTIFSKFPSVSLVLLPQSYNHHQHRNPCPHKRRAFTTSPLFLRDISAKFRVPNWFKCFEARS